ncbi:MAG: peptidylprolyl isomerase [Planctomycetes bacterium]|nr:peptidylprolyl isomerase [Planctomycetota bacterium]
MRSEGHSLRTAPLSRRLALIVFTACLGLILALSIASRSGAEEAPAPAPAPPAPESPPAPEDGAERPVIGPFGREAPAPGAAASAQEGETKEEGAEGGVRLPPGVVARVDGRDIVLREYADYLLASIGKRKLGEYIDRLLIAAEAQREGIVVTPQEVDELVESRIERTIDGIFQGDRGRYLEALERQGTSLEDRMDELRQSLYYETLLTKIILKRREIGDDALRLEFERVYGKDGVRFDLRHILVSTGRRTGPDGDALPPRQEAAARARAEGILQEIRAGADFVEQVKKYCDDTFTRRGEGRIPSYSASLFGPEFHAAVLKLSAEQPISEVVRSPRGFHIIQFLGRQETKFEDVKAALLEDLRRRPPSAKESLDAMARLREKAEIIR